MRLLADENFHGDVLVNAGGAIGDVWMTLAALR